MKSFAVLAVIGGVPQTAIGNRKLHRKPHAEKQLATGLRLKIPRKYSSQAGVSGLLLHTVLLKET